MELFEDGTPRRERAGIHRLGARPGAVKRSHRGRVRPRARARRDRPAVAAACLGPSPISTSRTTAPCIDAVIWKSALRRACTFKPEEGMEVIATGRLTTFPGSSKYQIIVEQLEPAGVGALMALLEERRQKLDGRGPVRRRRASGRCPTCREVIGVVTSPTGRGDPRHPAPPARPLPAPRPASGRCACRARPARRRSPRRSAASTRSPPGGPVPRPDVLIVARGGGCIEDLWGFNEEIVVRAAAESRSRSISAVGHETDTTLIDHAADRRAPTPTAAAEMAVPVRAELWRPSRPRPPPARRPCGRSSGAADLRASARALPSPGGAVRPSASASTSPPPGSIRR